MQHRDGPSASRISEGSGRSVADEEDGMTESGSSRMGSNEEIDDPGRDPAGLDPPRNLFGGADQDTGRGEPRGQGNVGPADKPESPTEEPDSRADTPDDV
jgi:hypothetical protein